jgi:hypothetical protein
LITNLNIFQYNNALKIIKKWKTSTSNSNSPSWLSMSKHLSKNVRNKGIMKRKNKSLWLRSSNVTLTSSKRIRIREREHKWIFLLVNLCFLISSFFCPIGYWFFIFFYTEITQLKNIGSKCERWHEREKKGR